MTQTCPNTRTLTHPYTHTCKQTTLTLVLHCGDGTLGGPVNRGSQLLAVVDVLTQHRQADLQIFWRLVSKTCCHTVLFLGEVAELIFTDSETHVRCVHAGVECHVGLVCCPVFILVSVVNFAVLGLECLEVGGSEDQNRSKDNRADHDGQNENERETVLNLK